MREPDLADRLRAEADRLDVSTPSTSHIARRGRRRARLRTGFIAFSVVAIAAASAGLGVVVTRPEPRHLIGAPAPGSEFEELSRGPSPKPSPSRPGRIFGDNPKLVDSATGTGGGGAGAGAATGAQTAAGTTPSVGGVAADSSTGTDRALTSPRVIKAARLRIEVDDDSLSSTLSEAERLAARHGGFVSESATTSFPARSGELTIRVPAGVFESVVADLKSLGRVESQRVSGVDVTAEFVDLEARLRNWSAHERVLVRLMRDANTIAESLQVQRELQGVRSEIERIFGQLRVLRDQTEFASISITIHEPGIAEEPSEDEGAWDRAVAAAGKVLEAILVGLGYLVPILGALLLLWLVFRAVRSRRPV